MNIMRSGSQPSAKGPAEYFTGAVRIDMPFKGSCSRAHRRRDRDLRARRPHGLAHPSFGPDPHRDRPAWAGCKREGGPKEDIRAGDIVWIPPGEKHWHGATATTAMTHIAIAEALDGKTVDWMEKVSDAQFNG